MMAGVKLVQQFLTLILTFLQAKPYVEDLPPLVKVFTGAYKNVLSIVVKPKHISKINQEENREVPII